MRAARNRKWTPEEDAVLIDAMERKLAYKDMGDTCLAGRAVSSIKDRACKLRRTAKGGALRYTARPSPEAGSANLLKAIRAYFKNGGGM